jgi:hypothetical protein
MGSIGKKEGISDLFGRMTKKEREKEWAGKTRPRTETRGHGGGGKTQKPWGVGWRCDAVASTDGERQGE